MKQSQRSGTNDKAYNYILVTMTCKSLVGSSESGPENAFVAFEVSL